MIDKATVINKVKSFSKELINIGIKLDSVILFGSYSKNQQHDFSDIDVALVSDSFSGIGYFDRKLFSKINVKKEFIEIEPKTYSTEYFLLGDPFIDEIKETGIFIDLG